MRIVQTIILLVGGAGMCAAQPPRNAMADPVVVEAQAPPSAPGDAKPSPKTPPSAKKPAKTKPPATGEAADKSNDAEEAPKPPKSTLPPPSTLYTEMGYGDWGLGGNESKFRQYATVPHGFFLRDLRYVPMFKTPSEYAFLNVKGVGQDDYRAETRLAWNYGATQAAGFVSRFNFFEPLPNPVNPNARQGEGFNVKQSLTRDFALSFRFRDDLQHNNYEIPYFNLNQSTQYLDGVASGKLGRGFASLNYSNLHYSDHTGTLLDFTAQTTGLSYLWSPSDAIDIEAAYAHVAISQPALQQSHVDVVSLNGDVALSSATDLNIRLQQRNLGLPNVQNAYVRAQGLGTASLFHRWKSWRAEAGFRLQDDERVNSDHTYVDVPKWSTVEGRLSGKLIEGWRLTLRGNTQTLFNPPPAATLDSDSLYWNSRSFFQAKLEGGPPAVSYYLVYTYQDKRNSARSTEVQTSQYTVGSVWQISPAVSLFGEYHHENWSGHTAFDSFPTLSDFLPDSTTGIVELTWNQRRLFLSASYTGFSESNHNPLLLPSANAVGNFVTLSGHYRFPRGYELGLTVAPWYYHDSVVGALDYNAAVVMVTGSARF